MVDIPRFSASGPAKVPEVKDNDSSRTNYLTVDPNSGTTSRVWPAGVPQAMATQSPTAKMLGALAADAGQSTPNPVTVAEEDVSKNSTVTPSRDAQGKTLPKYRMGIGQRILGTFANFANGFARNGASPVYVGPGALNNRYYQDEQERQQNLAGAKLRLGMLRNEPADNQQQPPEQTSPADTPPPLNESIPPVGPRAPRHGRYKARFRPAAISLPQTARAAPLNRDSAAQAAATSVSQQAPAPAPTLGLEEAKQYLSLAQGNPDLARKLARLDGHVV